MIACPYDDCPFQGTQAEVDDHVIYCIGFDDPDHRDRLAPSPPCTPHSMARPRRRKFT